MERKHLSTLLLAISLLVYGCLPGKLIEGKVISVQDGDTVTILKGRSSHRIRLEGIDCPEQGQAFGNVAKQYTSKMAFGKTVQVKYTGKDQYGRILGVVIVPGGFNLNEELLKAGLAWHYKYYNQDTRLAELERKARAARQGLWADRDPIPPWKWRKNRR